MIDPDDLRAVHQAALAAQDAIATLADAIEAVLPEEEPPAIVRPARRAVMVNIKLAESSAIDLAKKAASAGLTQKQWIAREMDPRDLADRTPRRRAAA